MAHNLNFNAATGKYSFFSVQEKAWHGLGQIVADYPTSAEALRFAGLDFEIAKYPLYSKSESFEITDSGLLIPSREINVPNYYANVRTDNNKVLGVVGKDYEIIQNTDAFSFFDAIVGGGDGIKYETAGALGDGERVFITAKLPDYIRIGASNDVIEQYLFLTTSHDGSGSITVAFTPVRIVCANTLNAAMHCNTMALRIRHTANAKQRLEQAHKVMGMSCKKSQELSTVFNQWAKIRITDQEVLKLIKLAMCPNKETLDKIQEGLFEETSTNFKNTCNDVFAYGVTSDTQLLETTKGTVFGAYNAITGYYQNVCTYANKEAKMKSVLLGGLAQTRTQKAFDLCADFVKDGAGIFQFN
ncbi:DUF932 domain-containing protein [Chitinophaga sp. MM2321]|uniref:DUF932 domain-containing protein n=1 Tax=Chitinophaga sp. MM2321 TaxID=3137178 RepID=UPI0032D58D39